MVKLSVSDERVFAELRSLLTVVQGMLTPLTERVAPVDVIIRGAMERLAHYDPLVSIAVVGHPGSGKSTLLNAILGCEALPSSSTNHTLQILPFDGGDLMLRKPAGKAVAVGIEGVKSHLESEKEIWLEELADRRLHAKLPLINGPHHYASSWCLLDTPTGTTGIKPNVSSVASRIHSPNVLAADLLLYCVNAAYIGDEEKEASVFDELVGDLEVADSTLHRLVASTIFVLTMSDIVSDEEECIDRLHNRNKVDPPLKKIADVQQRFLTLLRNTFGVDIDPSWQLLTTSGRNALLTNKILTGKGAISTEKAAAQQPGMPPLTPTVDIAHVYDYCEQIFGATFMQTIDSTPEEELQRMVAHHAKNTQSEKSGSNALARTLRLFDFNCVRHLIHSLGVTGAECVEQLVNALQLAKPALDVHVQENEEALEVLVKECDWVVRTSEDLGRSIAEMVNVIVKLIDEELAVFWKKRIEELQYVLEHRELSWFWERQASTVVEMTSSLKKLEAFTAKYGIQRNLLQQKILERDQLIADWRRKDLNARIGAATGGGPLALDDDGKESNQDLRSEISGSTNAFGASSSLPAGSVSSTSASPGLTAAHFGVPAAAEGGPELSFMHLNAEGLLRQMNLDKERFLLDFSTCFTHHIKDEYVRFLPEVMEKIDETRTRLVEKLAEEAHTPIEQTRTRTQLDFNLDSVVEQFLTVQALEANERRLNNCLRDLPEHVAGAAVQISEEWEQRRNHFQRSSGSDIVEGGGGGGSKSSVAAGDVGHAAETASLSQASVSIIHNRFNKNKPLSPAATSGGGQMGGNAAAVGINNTTTAEEEAGLLAEYAALMRNEAGAYVPADGFSIPEELRYVHEAWRLASLTIKMHQLTTYNIHDVKQATNQLSTTVLGYIGLYVGSLESAVQEQKELIQNCNDDALEVVRIHKELEPYQEKFNGILYQLGELTIRDIDAAESRAKKEAVVEE